MRSARKITVRGRIPRHQAEYLQLQMRQLARRAGLRVVKVRVRRVERKLKSSR